MLDAQGHQLFAVDLPAPRDGTGAAASRADAPDIDGDGELEVVIQTVDAGVVAYDLPGTRYARTLWPTGRGSYRRAGVAFNDRVFADGFGG